MNMRVNLGDVQQKALGFLLSQTTYIETAAYEVKYGDIQYPELIPVDTSAPEWIKSVTYYSADGVGKASWFNAKSLDVPNVEMLREKFETTVSMAAIGYRYDLEEIGQAMMLGIRLASDKANMARRAAEEFINLFAFFGDATKGQTGLVNNAAVTTGSAAATGTGATTTWSTKTADNILSDVNTALIGIYTGSLQTEMADTLLLPYAQMLDISTRRIDAVNQTTILEWIEKNNIYSRTTGQALKVRGVNGLQTAGSGSTPRMVAYRRDPTVVKLHMPMPFRFFPAMQAGPILFEVPGIFRLGGVDVRRPASMRYVDGL